MRKHAADRKPNVICKTAARATLYEPAGNHPRPIPVTGGKEEPMAQAITIHMGVLMGMLLAAAVFA